MIANKEEDLLDKKQIDNYNKFTSESGHWYAQDGEPMYTIIGANGSLKFIENQNPDEIVQGVFALKHLVLFSKCTNLCASIELYLKNDYPLIIEYMVASLGEIKLCLAPKVDS